MSSFTEFVAKPDWCRGNLKNGITDCDKGNDYVNGLDDKTMKVVYP